MNTCSSCETDMGYGYCHPVARILYARVKGTLTRAHVYGRSPQLARRPTFFPRSRERTEFARGGARTSKESVRKEKAQRLSDTLFVRLSSGALPGPLNRPVKVSLSACHPCLGHRHDSKKEQARTWIRPTSTQIVIAVMRHDRCRSRRTVSSATCFAALAMDVAISRCALCMDSHATASAGNRTSASVFSVTTLIATGMSSYNDR